MKRKIVKHGSATLTVSLPSNWTKKYGLKKGDLIEIAEREDILLLSAEKEIRPKSIELKIDNLDSIMLEWVLSALHKRGFDEIRLVYTKPRTKEIYTILQVLMTEFAVIEQTDKTCLLKAIAKDEAMEFDATLKRIFMVVMSFADSLLEYIKKSQFQRIEELFFLEKTVDRLVNFCERVLVKKGYKEFEKTCFLYLTAWNLEKISEYYYMLSQYLIKTKNIKLSKNLLNLMERTNGLIKLFYDQFYSFDIDKLPAFNEKQKNIVNDIQKSIKEFSPEEVIVAFYLQEIAMKTNFSGTLTALNYNFQSM